MGAPHVTSATYIRMYMHQYDCVCVCLCAPSTYRSSQTFPLANRPAKVARSLNLCLIFSPRSLHSKLRTALSLGVSSAARERSLVEARMVVVDFGSQMNVDRTILSVDRTILNVDRTIINVEETTIGTRQTNVRSLIENIAGRFSR